MHQCSCHEKTTYLQTWTSLALIVSDAGQTVRLQILVEDGEGAGEKGGRGRAGEQQQGGGSRSRREENEQGGGARSRREEDEHGGGEEGIAPEEKQPGRFSPSF